jgi:hypothetical protein
MQVLDANIFHKTMKKENPAYAAISTKPTFVESELGFKLNKANEIMRYYVPQGKFKTLLGRSPQPAPERDAIEFGKDFSSEHNIETTREDW